MTKKIKVGILFGGKSAEHEISLISAHNVIEAIDRERFDVVLMGIDKAGHWFLADEAQHLLENGKKLPALKAASEGVALVPESGGEITDLTTKDVSRSVDVVFPILHGTCGEDGTVQGLLKLADVPFVGAGVLGSAVGMDKDTMKRLMRDAAIPIAKFLTVHWNDEIPSYSDAVKELGTPLFVKPSNLGSSVGIAKAHNEKEYVAAVQDAFRYDTKIIVEEFIEGREIECAVLGNEDPKASVPGEVVPHHEFYSYEAKYLDENGAGLEIPAKLDAKTTKRVQELAVKAFKVLSCEGMARVDAFVKYNGDVVVNEINTIPGFTKISMYPKLWEASGVSYTELISKLIDLAIERYDREKKIKMSYGD
jgi:D-alanine-D-alanine ligase